MAVRSQMSGRFRYKAFISYSRAADGKLAPALQSGLERFAKPWYRLRAFRVFRDQTGLAVTPELWASIENAMARSEYFILLASPAAAQSRWVAKELEFWLENHAGARLLIVLTDGGIQWDTQRSDFDWSRTDALPRELEGKFTTEPNYLDLRWARTDTDLSVRRPRFLDAVAGLAATLRNVPLDDLIGEDVAHYQTARRLLRLALIVMAALTLAASYAAYLANRANTLATRLDSDQRNEIAEAERARQEEARRIEEERLAEIERQQRVETSIKISRSAMDLLPRNRELATLLAVEAARISATGEAESALRQAVMRRSAPVVLETPGDLTVLRTEFSADGQRLLAVYGDGSVRIWTLASPQRPVVITRTAIQYDGADGTLAVFSPDGTTVLTAPYVEPGMLRAPEGEMPAARTWDARTGELRQEFKHEYVQHAAFSPDSRRVVTVGFDDTSVRVWDAARGTILLRMDDHEGEVVSVDFSRDGRFFVTAGYDDTVRIRSAADGQTVALLRVPSNSYMTGAFFSPDSRWVVTLKPDDPVRFWDWERSTGSSASELPGNGDIASGEFSPNSQQVLTVDDGLARVWDVATGRKLFDLPHEDSIRAAAFSPQGRWIATVSVDGTAFVWDASTGRRLTDFTGYDRSRTSVAFSPDGLRVATGTAFGQILVHSCDFCGPVEHLLEIAKALVKRPLTPGERETYLEVR